MASLPFTPARMLPAYNPQYTTLVVQSFGNNYPIVGADPNRVMIWISPPDGTQTDHWEVYPGSPQNFRASVRVYQTSPGFLGTYHDWGPLIGYPWWVYASTASGNLGCWTMSYDPSLLGQNAPDGVPTDRVIQPPPADPVSAAVPPLAVGQPVYHDAAAEAEFQRQLLIHQRQMKKLLPPYRPVV